MKYIFIDKFKNASKNDRHAFLPIQFAVSYCIFLFIILILTMYLHHNTTVKATEEFWEQNESNFSSAVSLLDTNFAIIDSFCKQLASDSNFRSLSRTTDSNGKDFLIKGMTLKTNFPSHLYTYSSFPANTIFIYLRNTGYVASINSFKSESLYYIRNYSYTLLLESWRDCIYAENGAGTLYPLSDFVSAGSDDAYLYLVDMNTLTYSNVPATAGFHLSYTKLKDIFSGISLKNSYVIALDENGNNVLFLSDAVNAHENEILSQESALAEELKKLSLSKSFEELEYQNHKMHVTQISSDMNNWTYYLIQPDSNYSTPYPGIYALILVLSALLGALLIFFLVRSNMRPINELNTELQETITDRNQLQEVVEATRPIIYHTYLNQLLKGTISSADELEYIKSFLHLENSGLRYYVMYSIVYGNELFDNQENQAESAENLNEIIEQSLSNYFSYQNTLYLYSPRERVYAVLVPFEGKDDDMLIHMQEKILKIHEQLLEDYSIWFFTGVGLACPFSSIWESYQQAKDASGYTSKNYIFLPYEMLKKSSQIYYYPVEFASRMIQFINTGSKSQIIDLFNLIHKENVEERSLPIQLFRFLISDIRNTLLKARFSITTVSEENAAVLAEVDELLTSETLSFRTSEDIALKLCDLFYVKAEKTNLIDTIVDYIRINFRDPSLCLSKISDEFNISESYFSHMFKENMKVNFSVYLEDLRLNEAVSLIKEGKVPLSDIYLEVGYNNITSFRRAFKKKFGVTPSAMTPN